jgi:cbb3-type cytochrome c oxidase subunit III
MMPAKGVKPDLNGDQIKDLAAYVRSLSGLSSDSVRAQRGKELFAPACAACHGPDGKGVLGVAPNLADKVWLYSSSEETIIETITKGRTNRMPAFGEFLGDAKVHLLTAYVYGSAVESRTRPARRTGGSRLHPQKRSKLAFPPRRHDRFVASGEFPVRSIRI